MIDNGANPFIEDNQGDKISYNNNFCISKISKLKRLPTLKSVYFTVQTTENCTFDLREPWFYKTGVFPGDFDKVVGHGATAIVLHGQFQGNEAAFKFVDVEKHEKFPTYIHENVNQLNKKLNEMQAVQKTRGEKKIAFFGHFR